MEGLLTRADADTRVLFGMVEAEVAQRTQWRASAELFRAIDVTLREATAHPEVFVDAPLVRGDAVEFAIRAAVADLSARLSIAENTVRNHGLVAATLRERTPSVWGWFLDGEISTANARETSTVASELPAELWASFEGQVLTPARTLAPARFKEKARALRERLRADTLAERHVEARTKRTVFTELDRDGMGWLSAYLPVEDIAKVTANLDGIAFGLFTEPDETRTMNQLRADALTDLLTGAGSSSVGVTVAITIPALTMLGHSNEPAVMEGVGPIDIDTARRLTADAPTLTRLLTDPITGDVLTMDAKQYRPSKALKRWLAITQVTCDFPGCGRKAKHCDLDHTTDWAHGGTTTAANLTHRCRKHHSMKHQTKWHVAKIDNQTVWTSPTGYSRTADPPPF